MVRAQAAAQQAAEKQAQHKEEEKKKQDEAHTLSERVKEIEEQQRFTQQLIPYQELSKKVINHVWKVKNLYKIAICSRFQPEENVHE